MSWLHRLSYLAHVAPAPVPDAARLVRDGAGRAYGLLRTSVAQQAPGLGRVTCKRCLMHSEIPGTWIGADGLCQLCRRHEEQFSEARTRDALQQFLALRGKGELDLVLAVSGGKDSTAALVLARERLGLAPLAYLIRHEFLDPGAEARARAACDALRVPLEVHEVSLRAAVRQALRSRSLSPWPCLVCCEAQARVALQLCDRHGLRRIGTGLRALWDDEHTAITRASYAYRHFRVPARPDLWVANLIPACNAGPAEQRQALQRVGYQAPEVPGNTTNCLLLPVFESLHRERYGYGWEQERVLSDELRAGAIDRAAAEQATAWPDPAPELLAEVRARAGLR